MTWCCRGGFDHALAAEAFRFLDRKSLLFFSRVYIPHCHLNTGLTEYRAECRQVSASSHGPCRKRVTQIVEPQIALDIVILVRESFKRSVDEPPNHCCEEVLYR